MLNSISIFDDVNYIKISIAKNIGIKIKQLRMGYKMSCSDLAKVINLSQQQLSRYENGVGDISLSKIVLIAIYFKVSLEFFIIKEN